MRRKVSPPTVAVLPMRTTLSWGWIFAADELVGLEDRLDGLDERVAVEVEAFENAFVARAPRTVRSLPGM